MDIVKRCMELGAAGAAEVSVSKMVFDPELRALCERNACGRYGHNYTCPPYVGPVDRLIAELKAYPMAVIWQNIYPLEDSFDLEGMYAAQTRHNEMTLTLAREVYAVYGRDGALTLAAGGCTRCGECAQSTGEPCRCPGEALSSLEAYGIHVASLEAVTGLRYINGQNTVTFFSGVLVKNIGK